MLYADQADTATQQPHWLISSTCYTLSDKRGFLQVVTAG